MKINTIIAVLALSLTLNPNVGFSASKLAGAFSATCSRDKDDIYDPSVLLTDGPNKDKCLDTSVLRSIVLVNKDVEAGTITVANFRHEKKFWLATLNPNQVERMIFQIENFKAIVPAAHTQLRIIMKPGFEVKLVSQKLNEDGSRDTRVVRQIVASVEAVMTPDEKYGLVTGAMKHFGIAYRLVSMQDKFEHMITKDHHTVRQYILKLSDEEKNKVMNNILDVGTESQYSKFYHTTIRSCTTELFKFLDRAKGYSFLRKIKKATGALLLADIYPPEAAWGLSLRGLLYTHSDSKMANLDNDEELIEELESSKD